MTICDRCGLDIDPARLRHPLVALLAHIDNQGDCRRVTYLPEPDDDPPPPAA